MKVKFLSHVQLFVTPWTVAYHAPPSMGFSRQGYWSGLPFPSPGIFPTQGLNPGLLHCRQTLPSEPPGKPSYYIYIYMYFICACIYAKSLQSYPTLCNPVNCILPGPSVHGISQARVMERVPFPSPGDLPDPGMEPVSPALAGGFFTSESQGKPLE